MIHFTIISLDLRRFYFFSFLEASFVTSVLGGGGGGQKLPSDIRLLSQ